MKNNLQSQDSFLRNFLEVDEYTTREKISQSLMGGVCGVVFTPIFIMLITKTPPNELAFLFSL